LTSIKAQKKEGDAFFVKVTVKGKTTKDLEALIDSGATHSFVANSECLDNGLIFDGARSGLLCIHGTQHKGVEIPVYKGELELGDFSQKDIEIFGLDDTVTVGSKKIEAVLGRNMLSHFTVNLDWKNCKGELSN